MITQDCCSDLDYFRKNTNTLSAAETLSKLQLWATSHVASEEDIHYADLKFTMYYVINPTIILLAATTDSQPAEKMDGWTGVVCQA